MGEEWPLPGNGIFQRTLLVSLQRIGGLACGATPFANGPRHCGQLFESAALSQAAPPSASADTARRQPRLRACLENSGAGLRPAMNGRLARETNGARRPKGRRDACPTTFFKHVLRNNRGEGIIRDLYTPGSSRLKAAIPRAHDGILRRLNRKERIERRESRNEERVLALRAGSLLRPGKLAQLKLI